MSPETLPASLFCQKNALDTHCFKAMGLLTEKIGFFDDLRDWRSCTASQKYAKYFFFSFLWWDLVRSPAKTYCLPRRTILLSRFHRADYFYSHRTHKNMTGGETADFFFACLIMRVSGAGPQNYGAKRPAVINAVICREFLKIKSYSWRGPARKLHLDPRARFNRPQITTSFISGQPIILLGNESTSTLSALNSGKHRLKTLSKRFGSTCLEFHGYHLVRSGGIVGAFLWNWDAWSEFHQRILFFHNQFKRLGYEIYMI